MGRGMPFGARSAKWDQISGGGKSRERDAWEIGEVAPIFKPLSAVSGVAEKGPRNRIYLATRNGGHATSKSGCSSGPVRCGHFLITQTGPRSGSQCVVGIILPHAANSADTPLLRRFLGSGQRLYPFVQQ